MSGREPDQLIAHSVTQAVDTDPDETREWLDALEASVRTGGRERAMQLLQRLEEHAQAMGVVPHAQPYSAYRNTIPLEQQPPTLATSPSKSA